MEDIPQVALFGSIGGGWREKFVIPTLEALGVSYYNPVAGGGWTPEMGAREVEVMAGCETIVMVFNRSLPSFTGLAEAGWAALGAAQRRQNFILQIDQDYRYELPASLRQNAEGEEVQKLLDHWTRSSRYLVYNHAKQFNLERMHIVDDLDSVVAKLRAIYG